MILLMLILIPASLKSQVVSDVSIAGNFTVGSEVVASYIVQGSADTHFHWYEVSSSDTIQISTGSGFIQVPASSLNKRLLLKVSLTVAGVVADSAFSPLSPLVAQNQTPKADPATISGSKNVNDYLSGNYSYRDSEGDAEGNSIYEWRVSSSPTGSPSSVITGESSRTYRARLADQGRYIIFSVTPVAQTGTSPGTKVTSSPFGPINSAPVASNAVINGVPELGNILTGTYTYFDIDGDLQGSSIYRWYRDNVIITGATYSTYTLTPDDVGSRIHFEVIPVSSTGFPDTGSPATSSQTPEITDSSGDVPVASDLCISGTRSPGSVLEGKYTFTDNKYNEQGSQFFWYRAGTTNPIGTNRTYTVKEADMNSEITFAVIPRNNKGVPGIKEFSGPLAMINLPAETFSVADPDIQLQAYPSGGVFFGDGVSGGKFSPGTVGEGGPYLINYLLNITLPTNTCIQNASKSVMVNPVVTYFESFRDVYCHDGGHDTIYVRNVPAGATSKVFHVTNPAAVIGYLPGNDTAIIIDPGMMRPGNKVDTIFFTYVLAGSSYPAHKPFIIDSVGKVTIENLLPGDHFCTNDEPFTLYTNREGGTFTGPVRDGTVFDPSGGLGATSVVYTYVSSTSGCASSVSVPVNISPAPQVSFTVADLCIEHANDTTRFHNTTLSDDPVSTWLWEFRAGGGLMTSSEEHSGYLFRTGGLHQVKLTATTSNNCSSFHEKTIDLGVKPEADFYWLNECYHPDDSVRLFDRTLTGSPVISRTWDFYDGNLLTEMNPRYPKLAPGYLPVEYIVYTNYPNCGDTVRKDIFIRPTVVLGTDDYFEDFESGAGGWIIDEGINGSWALGTPDRQVINLAASGSNAWYTSYDIANQAIQSSSISSPCFDFSTTERPMISLKLWRRFDRNRDGAALQYKVGDNQEWEYLGTIDDGVEWFNSTLIKGRPGGDQIGWTTLQTPDEDYVDAKRRLDELNGKRDVKFRLVYGSDGTSQDNEGMAFDDVRIGTRSRNVLLEHFTNNSSVAVIEANNIVHTVSSALSKDVININYHSNFPGFDNLYNDIPSDMSARVLFYGLTKVPYSFVDGGTGNQFAGLFDYIVADLDSNELNKRSLISPQFMIEINPVISGGMLVVKPRITALENLYEENLTLYVSVTAREILTLTGANGETVFRNTLRKMLPDAGGINLVKTWNKNQVWEAPDLTWKVTNIYDARDIEIIAFIQNNISRKIYQARASGINDISVGAENLYGSEAPFTIYPNPAANRIVISFGEPLAIAATIEILDHRGALLRKYRAEPGQSVLDVNDHGLSDGLYVVRMRSGSLVHGIRKLVVSGNR